jgi:4a-hydroxytetrahydrobiopterin dehydratase
MIGPPPSGWKMRGERLAKTFLLPDFAAALAFVNRVAALAERERLYPELSLSWGRVDVKAQNSRFATLVDEEYFRK